MKPFAHIAAVVGSRFLLLVFLLLVALAQPARAQAPTLPSCGFEGGRPCNVLDWEYDIQDAYSPAVVPFICDRGLISVQPNLFQPPTPCLNTTRRVAPVDPWTDFALRNQENLGIDEPINWVSRLATHNAYNAFKEGYIDANQYWSLTDQLRQGSRHFQLDLHWFNGHLRLCHGQASGLGCSPKDRLYAYGIKEIADWLDANPGEIMTMDFEDYANLEFGQYVNHDNYVNDPLATYLGSKILTPAEWPICTPASCTPGSKTRLPTKREILAAGKQMIVLVSSGNNTTPSGAAEVHGGAWIFPYTITFDVTSSAVLDCGTQPLKCPSGVPNLDFRPQDRVCLAGIRSNYPGLDVLDPTIPTSGGFPSKLAMFSAIGEDRVFGPLKTWVTEAVVGQAAHCRISLLALDDVRHADNPSVPDLKPNDQRHQAAVWSWFEGDAGNSGDAALLLHSPPPGVVQPWNRWVSRNATDGHPFMCARPRSESGGPPESWYAHGEGYDWKVTSGSGTWFEGGQRCLAEFGPDYVFSVPVSGYQNVHASMQIANAGDAWINYNDIKNKGSWIINRRPIADAGPDQTVECNAYGTGTVTVNGSLSYDPDLDSLTYAWTGALQSATGAVATIKAPMGVSTIRLVVDDGYSGVGSSDMRVTVRDTIPPVIRSAVANPNSSWPPNHKMFPVRLSVVAHDTCDPNPRSRVVSVTSNEGTPADWQIVGPLEVMLRSERSGNGGDRVYTIWIQSTDASGNASTPRAVTVTIEHDQGKSKP